MSIAERFSDIKQRVALSTPLTILCVLVVGLIYLAYAIWDPFNRYNTSNTNVSSNKSLASLTPEEKCRIKTQDFINKVNTLRASLKELPLTELYGLDQSAQARVNDMILRHYYGHTNPYTQKGAKEYIKAYSGLDNYGEVLDSPVSADQAFNDFKTSPEHYSILTNPLMKNIGVTSSYNSKDSYLFDNNGNKLAESPAGPMCIVIADLGY